MRVGTLAIVLSLILAPAAARGEPPADPRAKPAKPAAQKPAATKPAANKPAAKKKPISLEVPPSAAEPGNAPAAKPGSVDLFPKAVLEKAADDPAQGTERRPGTPLGRDGGWKTHAAQAGVMVGIFGALAALCGSGNCTVPNSWTSWLPDSIEADRGPTSPVAPPREPSRKAH